jgi:hypothetical protein
MKKTHYCNNHSEPLPLFPCKIFDDITIGYYCVSCDDFVPSHNPEIGIIKKLFIINRKTETSVRRSITCVQ